MELAGRKVLVIGAGKSGAAAARFLKKRGATVALQDRKPVEEWTDDARSLKAEGVGLIGGDAPSWLLDQIDLVVMSPGVPTKKNIAARYVERKGGEVIGEIELASRFLRGRIAAITGTNGKTTTTTLIGELLRDAGLPTQVGGNIGTPLVDLVESSGDDGWTVVEVSSYQLETIVHFHPTVAVVLNLMPDHLDRYDSMTEYAAAKHRIFRNQQAGDAAILNADDEVVSSWAKNLSAHVTLFSVRRELEEGLFLRGDELVSRTREGERTLLRRSEMKLRGLHNVENVLAALAAGLACGTSPRSMRETIKRFRPVEHRLELVAEIGGVEFFNDSKATNVDAALKALEAFAGIEGRIVLIAGGRGKNAPYAPLAPILKEKSRALVTIGEDAARIERELKDAASQIFHATDMRDAVRCARAVAQSGDVVLLAPACASFDMFANYEERGRIFKEEVTRIRDSEFRIQKKETEKRFRLYSDS